MYVASPELSKELYELTGWDDTGKAWFAFQDDWAIKETPPFSRTEGMDYPAYGFGYLLRKLPKFYTVWTGELASYGGYVDEFLKMRKMRDIDIMADTPEDAACKLAIELIKQGLLKP